MAVRVVNRPDPTCAPPLLEHRNPTAACGGTRQCMLLSWTTMLGSRVAVAVSRLPTVAFAAWPWATRTT